MQITKVILENWGPYRNVNEFDIHVSKDSPVVVIWGWNGHGKTKFIDALKWVFAGGDLGYVKVGPYISQEAIQAGDVFETKVTVEFQQSGIEYLVTRSIKIDPALLEEPGDPALAKRLLTMPDKTQAIVQKIGEAAYSPEQSRLVLLRLFPARLVNFYFFDAAALIESFDSISNAEMNSFASSADIQNSVETAMGFKGFESYIEMLKGLASSLSSKADKEVSETHKLQRLKEQKAKAQDSKKVLEQDVLAMKDMHEQKSLRLTELKRSLDGMSDYLDLQRSREAFRGQLKSNRDREKAIREQLNGSFVKIWAAPSSEKILGEYANLERIQAIWETWQSDVTSARIRVKNLSLEASHTSCSTCGRELEKTHKEHIQQQLILAEKYLLEIEAQPPGEAADFKEISLTTLRRIWNSANQANLDAFLTLSLELQSVKVEIADLQQKITSITTQLGTVDDVNFVAIFGESTEIEILIRDIEANLEGVNKQIAEKTQEIHKCDTQINSLAAVVGGNSRSRMLKVQKLIQELSFVLAELKNKVRETIQLESNQILQNLVLDQDKQFNIYVDADYTLRTDKFNPNAGFKQQVILSFLFAIPRVAGAPFPVIIDSPLQHLGVQNKTNFLEWCKSGLAQLVLLPHDAELNREEIPEIFGSSLSRFYELVHDSDSHESSVNLLSKR